MANIQFRVNNGKAIKDKTKPQRIYLRYRLGRLIDFGASIGFEVLLTDWENEKQRVKNKTNISNRYEVNNLISNLTNHFETFENKNRESGIIPTYKDVKEYYQTYFTTPEIETEKTFFSCFEQFLIDCKTQPNLNTKKPLRPLTITSYRLTKNVLKTFNDEVYKFDFDKISLSWYYDFLEWNYKQNNSNNYIGKHIKNLKAFLNSCNEKGYTTNTSHRDKRFITLKEESDSVALTIEELQRIWNLNLSKDQKLDNVRDIFLIGAYTGLRVSDFKTLTTDKNLKESQGVKMLKVTTEKTGKVVAIPLHPIVNQILLKYNNNVPKEMTEKDINELIKVVCKRAKINSIEHITITKGGKKVSYSKQKYTLVSSHTARRSFCTNAYLMGMNSLDIMSLSGHTTESTFLKYIKVTPEQVAIKMSEHAFFKNGTALKVV